MGMVSRYVVIRDGSIDIPRPPSEGDPGGNDVQFQFTIDPPAPSTTEKAVLFFQVNPRSLPVRLRVRINQDVVLEGDTPFDTDPQRSFHEAYTPRDLRAGPNELVASVPNDAGRVTVSDFVLLFQSVAA
jgi:hypothetical protein